MTVDLISIRRNPYLIFDTSLVVIGLQLFKVDPKPNQTGAYTHPYTHIIHNDGFAHRMIPLALLLFKPGG